MPVITPWHRIVLHSEWLQLAPNRPAQQTTQLAISSGRKPSLSPSAPLKNAHTEYMNPWVVPASERTDVGAVGNMCLA
jgi:hypothetical protein